MSTPHAFVASLAAWLRMCLHKMDQKKAVFWCMQTSDREEVDAVDAVDEVDAVDAVDEVDTHRRS